MKVAWHKSDNDKDTVSAIWSNVSRLLVSRVAHYEWLRRLALDSSQDQHEAAGLGARARHNIILNGIESVQAEAARDLPRPMLTPIGADWKTRRKIQLLQRVIDGEWKVLGADPLRENQVHDAALYGSGILRVGWFGGRVRITRVHPAFLLAEPDEAASGSPPTTRYQVTIVNRWALADEYPEMRKEIERDQPPSRDLFPTSCTDGVSEDLRVMVEAWCLATGTTTKGRYVVCTPNVMLHDDDEWHGQSFPHSVLPFSRDPEDPTFGRGLTVRMAGQQDEQNSTAEIMSDNTRIVAGVRYVLYNSANIIEGTLDDESGGLLRVDGPPGSLQLLTSSGNAMDLVQNARLDRQEMLADQGISPLSTSGQIPDQVDSGKAQQVYHDKVQGRRAIFGRNVERATCELAMLWIDALEEAVVAGEDAVKVCCAARKGSAIDLRKYSEVRVGRDHIHAEVFPVSTLSRDIPGRMADITEMVKAQVLSPQQGRRLMSIPDLERDQDLASAAIDLAMELVDRAMDLDAAAVAEGKSVALPRVADRDFMISYGWSMYAYQLLEGATEDDLAGLRLLIGTAESQVSQERARIAAAAAAAAVAPVPGAPAPAAAPAAAPMTMPAAMTPQAAGLPGAMQ